MCNFKISSQLPRSLAYTRSILVISSPASNHDRVILSPDSRIRRRLSSTPSCYFFRRVTTSGHVRNRSTHSSRTSRLPRSPRTAGLLSFPPRKILWHVTRWHISVSDASCRQKRTSDKDIASTRFLCSGDFKLRPAVDVWEEPSVIRLEASTRCTFRPKSRYLGAEAASTKRLSDSRMSHPVLVNRRLTLFLGSTQPVRYVPYPCPVRTHHGASCNGHTNTVPVHYALEILTPDAYNTWAKPV